MMSEKHIKNLLFIDIETVSGVQSFGELPERLQKEWTKKSAYVSELQPSDSYFQKAAIYSEFGRIIAIGLGILYYDGKKELSIKTTSISSHDEKTLLNEFIDILNKYKKDDLTLCAHNGKEFDFPYISRRIIINGLKLPHCFNNSGKKPWDVRHIDTMDMWKFGDRKNFTSLELLSAVLNIPSSKADIDGSQINQTYYIEKDLPKIASYAQRDVINVIQIYLKLNNQEIVKSSNIEMV